MGSGTRGREHAAAAYTLALDHGIRVPDAAHIEVARHLGATMIGVDRAQLHAAAGAGVTATPLNEVPGRIS